MPGTDYKVQAVFSVKGVKEATAGLSKVSSGLGDIGTKIRGAESGIAGTLKKLLAFGAAAEGVRRVGGFLASAVHYASDLQKSSDDAATSIGGILSVAKGLNFEEARKQGAEVFKAFDDAEVNAAASAEDMVDVFKTIVGPLSQAGEGMGDIEKMTMDALAVSKLFGLEMGETRKTIRNLVTGDAAEMSKLYKSLHDSGAIKETAEAWNKLTQSQRIAKLKTALGAFTPAAQQYTKTWEGVITKLSRIRENMMEALGGPVLNKLKGFFDKVGSTLANKSSTIEAGLSRIGSKIADSIGPVLDRAANLIIYAADHWDEIVAKINKTIDRVKALIPDLIHAAKLYTIASIGREVVGGGMQVADAAQGAYGAAKEMGLIRAIAPAIKAATAAAPGAGVAAVGAGELGAGFGALGAAGIESTFAWMGPTMTQLAAAAAPLATVLAVVIGAVELVSDHWTSLALTFTTLLGPSIGNIIGAFRGMYTALAPVLKLLVFIGAMATAAPIVGLVWILGKVAEGWGYLFELFNTFLPGFKSGISAFIEWVLEKLRMIGAISGSNTKGVRGLGYMGGAGPMRDKFDPKIGAREAPVDKKNIINDFRGSKIQVKQDFRDADPDNVAYMMINDIGKQAAARSQSGYVPALSR